MVKTRRQQRLLESRANNQVTRDLEQLSVSLSKTDVREMDEMIPNRNRGDSYKEPASAVSQKPIPAPTFNGTTDVDKFIKTFEAIARHNKWSESEKQLRLQLAIQGLASRSVQGDTCEVMYQQLQTQYRLTTNVANSVLRSLRFTPKDNIYQFGEKVLTLVQKTYPDLSPEQHDTQAKQEVVYAVSNIQ